MIMDRYERPGERAGPSVSDPILQEMDWLLDDPSSWPWCGGICSRITVLRPVGGPPAVLFTLCRESRYSATRLYAPQVSSACTTHTFTRPFVARYNQDVVGDAAIVAWRSASSFNVSSFLRIMIRSPQGSDARRARCHHPEPETPTLSFTMSRQARSPFDRIA
jgi:hypothetical protein